MWLFSVMKRSSQQLQKIETFFKLKLELKTYSSNSYNGSRTRTTNDQGDQIIKLRL